MSAPNLLERYAAFEVEDTTISQESEGGFEEIEYIFFYKLLSLDQLEVLSSRKESQEQWGLSFVKGDMENNIRTRKVARGTDITYYITNKTAVPGEERLELEQEANRKWFDIIKGIANSGMIKDRYYIPINGTSMVWEIDVFYDDEGRFVPWIKVDLEVPDRSTKIPEFPLDFEDSITNQGEARTKQEVSLVKGLFKNHFLQKK